MTIAADTRLASADIASLDPCQFMAGIGKRVIHPGGRHSTETLIKMAELRPGHRVLDVDCGVGTTAIEIARGVGSQITAVDISPLMLQRAQRNVQAAGLAQKIAVAHGNILELAYADGSFDRVIAEAVTMFVDTLASSSSAAPNQKLHRPDPLEGIARGKS